MMSRVDLYEGILRYTPFYVKCSYYSPHNTTKRKWIRTYLNLKGTSPIVAAFGNLGEGDVDPLLYQTEFEEFVCIAYSKNTATKEVSALRWELFCDHQKEGEQLPPTSDTLIPHIQRSHVIAQIAKGYRHPHPEILPLIGIGWEETSPGVVTAKSCLSLPAPDVVLALTKCSCRTHCGPRCSCVINGLPCTGLCKCADCSNTSNRYSAESDDDDDNDNGGV